MSRMSFVCRSVCASLIVASVVSLARADDAGPLSTASRVDAIFKAWNSASTPGCAVGVTHRGERLLRAYGSADLEHDVANDVATVFEAGSSSKQFTAAAILMLAEQRKLSLSDDVRKYVPELPDYGDIITIDQLLSHTNGLRDWGEISLIAGWPRTTRAYTMSDVLGIISRQRALNHRPGTEYAYTNSGYSLLTLIVQRVSGQPLARFARDHLFLPLGMTHTQWRDEFRRVVKHRAIAYQKTAEGYEQNMPFEDTYGHGGLLTTVGDLLIWNDALSNARLGTFVTTELQRRARLDSGHEVAYARGLIVADHLGSLEIAHAGATAGYRAWLGRYPQHDLSIALLCNAGEADPVALAHAVAEMFLPVSKRPNIPATTPAPAPDAPYTPTPRELRQCAGIYVSDEARAAYAITVEGGQLVMTLTSRPEISLRLTPVDRHAYTADGALVSLRPDRDGRITELLLTGERVRKLRFTRADDAEGVRE